MSAKKTKLKSLPKKRVSSEKAREVKGGAPKPKDGISTHNHNQSVL